MYIKIIIHTFEYVMWKIPQNYLPLWHKKSQKYNTTHDLGFEICMVMGRLKSKIYDAYALLNYHNFPKIFNHLCASMSFVLAESMMCTPRRFIGR